MQKLFELIKIIDSNLVLYEIFKSCPYEILRQCQIKKYPAGTIICHQGEVINCFSIIVSGAIDVFTVNENGKKYTIATHQCGAIIGEMEFFQKKPFVCSVEAVTDLTVVEIKPDFFLKWVAEDRKISAYVIEVLSNKFYYYSLKVNNDIMYPLKDRICTYLLSRCKQQSPKTTEIEVKVNKEKLSEEFAVTSRSIHRILHNLQKKNIIKVKTDAIIVKELDLLAAEVEGRST
ncbi:MAG TPA: Crp/Fnr family transcriptional regulator [Firmicutes bacterium]|nr:Crp/Fnr family transcriptional regulator [Bacillota bacterium]